MSPNEVQIVITLKLDQVNLVLSALGKLPFEQVDHLVTGFRSAALQALKAAEEQALLAAQLTAQGEAFVT